MRAVMVRTVGAGVPVRAHMTALATTTCSQKVCDLEFWQALRLLYRTTLNMRICSLWCQDISRMKRDNRFYVFMIQSVTGPKNQTV